MASAAVSATGAGPTDAVPAVKGCGKQCMGPCCLPGSTLPRYCFPAKPAGASRATRRNFSYTNLSSCSSTTSLTDSGESSGSESSAEEEAQLHRSFLDSLIVSLWDERAEEGLFRYDVTACETKVIPGPFGFVAQYNEGRHMKKRPTEFAADAVMQTFDSAKFNFTKVGQREALLCFEDEGAVPELPQPAPAGTAVYLESAAVPGMGSGASPNIVAINVSPIEYGHVLLIPRVLDRIPQRMDSASLLLALRLAAEVDNPYFRLGYNSLGAFATVNHLHFQGYYLRKPFAIELAGTSPLWGPARAGGVTVSELKDYPVRGLSYDVAESPREAAELIGAVCEALQAKNQPYNMFISGCGTRVFLWPQCLAERQAKGDVEADLLETQVNAAVFEISGHMVMKRREDFESIDEALAVRLLAAVSLTEEAFGEVKSTCVDLANTMFGR